MNLKDRNQKQRNFFNDKIDSYDQVHDTYIKTKQALINSLPTNTKKVLDLGAGTGLELIHLFELYPNVEVTAIDISENMLFELSKRKFSNKVKIICGDFFEINFGDNYDAVISTSALHHFRPEEKIILYKKVFDCLKEDGIFVNCDKISLSQEQQDKMFKELENNIESYKHIDTPLTKENEIKILKQVGFSNIEDETVDKNDYSLIKANKKS